MIFIDFKLINLLFENKEMTNQTTITDTVSNKPHTIRVHAMILGCDLAELFTAEAKIKIFQNDILFNENKLF
jgi:hypothetical protein